MAGEGSRNLVFMPFSSLDLGVAKATPTGTAAQGPQYAGPVAVTVRLFAGLREHAGFSERELDGVERVADVWPALGLGDEPAGLLYAVNRRYAAFRVTEAPLSLDAAVAEVADDEAGAIATFTGTVRRRSRDRDVLHLDYEAYAEMAEDVMAEIAAGLAERYTLTKVAIHHRVGRLEIGAASVVVAVSAPHRADALAACRDAIDALKEQVPLWKKEVYEGGEEWIGRGS
jgi:molybdopterin synthase catalytic subunit